MPILAIESQRVLRMTLTERVRNTLSIQPQSKLFSLIEKFLEFGLSFGLTCVCKTTEKISLGAIRWETVLV